MVIDRAEMAASVAWTDASVKQAETSVSMNLDPRIFEATSHSSGFNPRSMVKGQVNHPNNLTVEMGCPKNLLIKDVLSRLHDACFKEFLNNYNL